MDVVEAVDFVDLVPWQVMSEGQFRLEGRGRKSCYSGVVQILLP